MNLVILSANFPYGQQGDNCFLQNEMNALSEAFSQVTVVSTGDGPLRGDLPENFIIKRCALKFRLLKMLRAFFLTLNNSGEAIRELKKLYKTSTRFGRFKQVLKYNYAYLTLYKTISECGADADVIYSYWTSSRAYAAVRLKQKGIIKCPIISRAHRFDLYFEPDSLLPFRKLICENLTKIYFISEHGKEYFIKNYSISGYTIPETEVRYLGLNGESCKKTHIESAVLNIVTCSNVIPVKRLDIIIDALAQIKEFPIRWTHFGDGSDYEKIKALAAEKLSQCENIEYRFTGALKNREIQEYYRNNQVDLFINCSDSEGVPVSIMEAIAFGIPVICRNVGGNAEINRGNNEGFLLHAEAQAFEFAQAIKDFYGLPSERKATRGEEMRTIFEQYFSKSAIDAFATDLLQTAVKYSKR